MIRHLAVAVLLFGVAACERADAPKTGEPGPTPSPMAACNDLAIDTAIFVAPRVTAASAEAEVALLGGPITPGAYDLTRVEQRGGAAEWQERVWQSVRVADTPGGQTLEFVRVEGAADAEAERFNAQLQESAQPVLAYTCGRTGQAPLQWSALANELHLLLPAESGAGQTLYVFAPRAR